MGKRFSFATQAPPADVLANCINGQAELLRHSVAVTLMELPAIVGAPSWYTDFMGNWINISSHAEEWQGKLATQVRSIPKQLADLSELFAAEQAAFAGLLDQLRAQPNDATARAALAEKIATLSELVGSGVRETAAVHNNIVAFGAKLGPDCQILKDACAAAFNNIAIDRQAVRQLKSDIDALNARIDADNQIITAGGVTIGLGVSVAIAGIVVASRLPEQVSLYRGMIGFGVTAAATAILAMTLADADIKQTKKKIEKESGELQSLDVQIAVLQLFAQQAADLATAAEANATDLAEILAGWDVLSADIGEVKQALVDEKRDLDANDFTRLKADFDAAAAHWQEVGSAASMLATIRIDVTTTPQWVEAS